jgi:hypothetical protein
MRIIAALLLLASSAAAEEYVFRVPDNFREGGSPQIVNHWFRASYPDLSAGVTSQWEARCVHWRPVLDLIVASQRFYALTHGWETYDRMVRKRLGIISGDKPWMSDDAAVLAAVRDDVKWIIDDLEKGGKAAGGLITLSILLNYAARHGHRLDFSHFKLKGDEKECGSHPGSGELWPFRATWRARVIAKAFDRESERIQDKIPGLQPVVVKLDER